MIFNDSEHRILLAALRKEEDFCKSHNENSIIPICKSIENKVSRLQKGGTERVMAVSKSWLVYGAEGHRQRMAFRESVRWDWSNEKDGTRIFEALNFDKTGTYDYSLIKITRNTAEECMAELIGQLTDGYFENSRVGNVVEISEEE